MLIIIAKIIIYARRARGGRIVAAYTGSCVEICFISVIVWWNTTANIIIQPFRTVKIANSGRMIIQKNIISYQIFAKFIKCKISGALYKGIYEIMFRQQFEQKTCHCYSPSNPNEQKSIQAYDIFPRIFFKLLHKYYLNKLLQTILSLTNFSELNQFSTNINSHNFNIGHSFQGEYRATFRF